MLRWESIAQYVLDARQTCSYRFLTLQVSISPGRLSVSECSSLAQPTRTMPDERKSDGIEQLLGPGAVP